MLEAEDAARDQRAVRPRASASDKEVVAPGLRLELAPLCNTWAKREFNEGLDVSETAPRPAWTASCEKAALAV